MDTKALRQKILHLAIRGKLVPQDPNDEPASVLLERIRTEKERLIAEGKIKRPQKAKSSSSEYHYQKFEIPNSWKWITLPEACLIPITDGTHQTPTYSDKDNGVPFLSSKDVTSRSIDWNNIKYITKSLHEELYKRIAPQKWDILLAKNGTTGVAAMVETDAIFDIYVTLALIRPALGYIHPKYLLYVINSNFCKEQFNTHLTGIGLPNLHLIDIQRTMIPLPPYKEQIRIADKLDEYLYIIDKVEEDVSSLALLVSNTKSKILELAMQGKLVPQNPTDEPATDILRRVNPKARIITDNPHYPQLPDNWIYVSIDDINEYKSRSVNPAVYPEQVFDLYSVPIYPTGEPERLKGQEIGSTKQTVKCGDILLCKINPHLNRVWFIDSDSDHTQIASSEWIVVRPKELYAPFIREYFTSPAFRKMLCSQVSGVGGSLTRAQPSLVKQYLVPIPPYEEQIRIVEHMSKFIENLTDIEVNLTTL